jgi:hypothetical protein
VRVRLPHLRDDDARQAVRVAQADAVRLVDRAAQQPPADVAATLVRRLDPLRDQERRRTPVVGEHAVCAPRDVAVLVRDSRLRFDPVHDLPEAVGVEHRVDVCNTSAVRSMPMPVSTFWFGSRSSTLPGRRSYSMKTRL